MNVNVKYRRWLWNGLRLVIVAGIFAYLFYSGQFDPAKLRVVVQSPLAVVAATLLFLAGFIISVERWRILLRVQDIMIGFRPAFQLSCIGLFFNMILPGSVSGDVIKGYYLVRGQDKKTALATTILADRLIGLYTIILVAALAVAFGFIRDGMSITHGIWGQKPVRVLALFISLLGTGFTIAIALFLLVGQRSWTLIHRCVERLPFAKWMPRVIDGVMRYANHPILLLRAILLSAVSQAPLYMGVVTLAYLLGVRGLLIADYLFILPVCFVINSIPIAPGGWGVGEAGFRSVFLLYGVEVGAEAAFLMHSTILLLAVGLGGAAYVAWNKQSKWKENTKES